MRAVLLILAAIGLAALAVVAFMHGEWLTGTAFLAGALAIILPVFVGEGFGSLGDADLLIRFVRNPFGTIVDETLDRLTQEQEQPSRPIQPTPTDIQMPERFDPDAAIARYLASKNAAEGKALPEPATAPAPAIRTFGRKQV